MSSAQHEETRELIGHLFREEAGKIVSRLVRILGLHNLAVAEEVVQETLCRALEVWKFKGVPKNPSAWLMLAAKNRAIDVVRQARRLERIAPHLADLVEDESFEAAFFQHEIRDDQLRLMFSCCHPQLQPESQIMLILKMLCGFSTQEIARAFLTTVAAAEKRLTRARATLVESAQGQEVAGESQLQRRLDSIHQALYLLFNEGYHASSDAAATREELCFEAMRLARLLSEHPTCQVPATYALLALMCFHAARLGARVDDDGALILLGAQDRSRWDRELIGQGFKLLEKCGSGSAITAYHLEAGIAAEHCIASSVETTDWQTILKLYDLLLQLAPSPIVALNRAIVVGQLLGPERGLEALAPIAEDPKLKTYRFLSAAFGEFHRRAGRPEEALRYFREALARAANRSEARSLEEKIEACSPGSAPSRGEPGRG